MEREAAIRITIKNAGFLSGMRQMSVIASNTGKKMGRALSAPMSAGFVNAKASMKSMFSSVGGHMKTVGTLGGAFAIGKFMTDSVNMQHIYRNITHNINKAKGNTEDWRSIMDSINPIADKTGQTAAAMAQAFNTVFSATGDLEFTKASIEAIGVASTASGIEASKLASAMELAYRKFGIGANESEEAMTAFIEKIGIGGMSADDLNTKFAVMAGEAGAAGMTGVKGMSTLLGVMLKLDSTIGEKASPGLKAMFQFLKMNTTQLKAMEKAGGMKFTPDMTAFQQIGKILETERGRTAAETIFTADSRVVFDTLAKPFKEAYKEAMTLNKGVEQATKLGMGAYKHSLTEMSSSTMKFSELQRQTAERIREDPTVIMRKAINKMSVAFTDKRMMSAINTLAKTLPKVAEGFVNILDFILNHPALAVGGVIGAKVGLSFAGGMLTSVGTKIGTSAMALMNKGAFATGSKMGMAAKMALVGGAAFIGFEIGKSIANAIVDAQKERQDTAFAGDIDAFNAARSKDPKKQQAALMSINQQIAAEKARQGSLSGMAGSAMLTAFGGASVALSGDKSLNFNPDEELNKLQAAQAGLEAAIRKQKIASEQSASGTDKQTQGTSRLNTEMGKLTETLSKLNGAGAGPPNPLFTGAGHSQ